MNRGPKYVLLMKNGGQNSHNCPFKAENGKEKGEEDRKTRQGTREERAGRSGIFILERGVGGYRGLGLTNQTI